MTPEQRTRAIVHNAADRALSSRGHWVPLSVRVAITDSVLAALAEQGYAIVPATAPQSSGSPQDAQTAGDGISGRSDTPEASTGLSDVQMVIADRYGTRRITLPDATPSERAAFLHVVELENLRAELETARAQLAAIAALHPHTELDWWHPCKKHSITDEEATLNACPNCVVETVMGCPRCDDACEYRKILHPDSPEEP